MNILVRHSASLKNSDVRYCYLLDQPTLSRKTPLISESPESDPPSQYRLTELMNKKTFLISLEMPP